MLRYHRLELGHSVHCPLRTREQRCHRAVTEHSQRAIFLPSPLTCCQNPEPRCRRITLPQPTAYSRSGDTPEPQAGNTSLLDRTERQVYFIVMHISPYYTPYIVVTDGKQRALDCFADCCPSHTSLQTHLHLLSSFPPPYRTIITWRS